MFVKILFFHILKMPISSMPRNWRDTIQIRRNGNRAGCSVSMGACYGTSGGRGNVWKTDGHSVELFLFLLLACTPSWILFPYVDNNPICYLTMNNFSSSCWLTMQLFCWPKPLSNLNPLTFFPFLQVDWRWLSNLIPIKIPPYAFFINTIANSEECHSSCFKTKQNIVWREKRKREAF